MMMAGQCTPHFLFETSKRKCAVHGGKEKMFRRVGPHACGPPASGDGRLAIPRGSQGRKRAALGESFSPGESQIHSAPLSAAAGLSLRDKGRHMGRPLQNAGGFLFSCRGGPVCPPVGKPLRGVVSGSGDRSRGYSIFHPGFPLHRTRGAGLTQLSCPARVGRRPAVFVDTDSGAPRQRGGQLHRSTTKKRSFLLDRSRPVFFSARPKRKWGGGMVKPPSRLDSSPIGVISNNFRTNSPI